MRKILVVEDMEGMQMAISRYLEKLRARFPHAEISFVSTLEDAWPILREIPPPDVTFLDLGLPPHTWEEMIEKIPDIDALSPVIVMTGYPAEKVREMMKRPDIDVLEKGPGMWDWMIEFIARAISRKRSSKNLERVDETLRQLREMIPPPNASP